MRNLENFGVQEMSLGEQKSIDGGVWLIFTAVCFAVGVIAGLWNKSDSCQKN